jgi:hypothetical protein
MLYFGGEGGGLFNFVPSWGFEEITRSSLRNGERGLTLMCGEISFQFL